MVSELLENAILHRLFFTLSSTVATSVPTISTLKNQTKSKQIQEQAFKLSFILRDLNAP